MDLTALDPTDTRPLRDALGCFATGVCVLTGCSADGAPFGMTINSFGSVSLSPARVCWSVDRATPDADRYAETDAFAVSVLSREQAEICFAFAGDDGDRFAGRDWAATPRGCPLVAGAIAAFDCTVTQRVDVGDHVLCIAAVEATAVAPGAPLGFWAGGLVDAVPLAGAVDPAVPFSDRYSAALLGRASAVLNGDFATRLPEGLKAAHWRVLACLVDGALTVNALAEQVVVKQPTLTRILDTMVERGLVVRQPDPADRRRVVIAVTDAGAAIGTTLRAAALEHESDTFAQWTSAERAQLVRLLGALLARYTRPTDSGGM
ncbi:MAG: flavin reductase [Pseudomonadota bacterium]